MHHPDPQPVSDSDPRSDSVSDPKLASLIGVPNGAKYKSMSPARLPLAARSPCLTVPPGLSPGALLDSPVLLSNMKAEPSPTTGTFSLHAMVNARVGLSSVSSPRGSSKSNAQDEGSSSDFEFKPHIRSSSSSSSGLSSLGPLAYFNSIQQELEPCRQMQTQSQIQTPESSQVQANNTVHSSHELTLSTTGSASPTENLPMEVDTPEEMASDELEQIKDSNNSTQITESDPSGSSPSSAVEKSSDDGYNWRKYGQKLVKGSEFPRSYYKCTHPNCQMKKHLERSHDGQITEIIYKGRHDHPKPEPNRRIAVGTIPSGREEERSDRLSSVASAEEKLLNARCFAPNVNGELSPVSPSDDDVDVGGGVSNHDGNEVADDDDPESKRRKKDIAAFDSTQIGKNNREPRVVVQTVSEVDILDDGYRWRKYGQKVVKGNPNPRSYYKCTNAGCSVRKHVERASHDPKAVITTYEGKHNHDVPAARNSSHDTAPPTMANPQMPTALNGVLRATYDSVVACHPYHRADATNMISLDLGVGIHANHGNSIAVEKPAEQSQGYHMQQYAVQAAPTAIIYGRSSNGLYRM